VVVVFVDINYSPGAVCWYSWTVVLYSILTIVFGEGYSSLALRAICPGCAGVPPVVGVPRCVGVVWRKYGLILLLIDC
jgi:hypothetical protein